MGIVAEKRTERLLEKSLLEFLNEGRVPSPDVLLDEYRENAGELRSLSSSEINEASGPQRWELSSTGRINEFLDAFRGDFTVLSRALIDITQLCILTNVDWTTRARALEGRLAALKSRIESLILLKSDTAGFLSFVEDGFFSLEDVAAGTTAEIDVSVGEVSLRVDEASGTGEERGTLLDIEGSHANWTMLAGSNIRYTLAQSGQEIENVLSDSERIFSLEAEASHLGKTRRARTLPSVGPGLSVAAGELKLTLPVLRSISKVSLLMSDATAGAPSVVGFQYSSDGYAWAFPETESAIQSGTGSFVFRFPGTEARFIKFLISKSAPDEIRAGSPIYDFGVRQVKVYSEQYVIKEGGEVLLTEELTPELGGRPVSFSRASLEVCEEVPRDTSIEYFLKASNSTSSTDWVAIAPLSRGETQHPAVVDFGGVSELSTESTTLLWDPTLNKEALNLARLNGTSNIEYRFGGPNDTLLNCYLEYQEDNLSDLLLMRNFGYSDSKFPAISEDLLVGEAPCGWKLIEGDSYFCHFLVKNPSGLEIDFGGIVKIDGHPTSGLVSISPGWHTFETLRTNWLSLTGTNPMTGEEFASIDPLYPYNHKYLIEGFNYHSAFSERRLYLGVDNYCAYRPMRIGRYQLLSQFGYNPNIYAIETIGDRVSVFMKYDSSDATHVNERARLFYSVSGAEYTDIELKAILKTMDAERTPVLTYYRVRVK